MKHLRMLLDYFCSPIWHDDGELTGEFGDVNPYTLPIPKILADQLMKWAHWNDSGVDMNDSGNSKDMSPEEKRRFMEEGNRLFYVFSLCLDRTT